MFLNRVTPVARAASARKPIATTAGTGRVRDHDAIRCPARTRGNDGSDNVGRSCVGADAYCRFLSNARNPDPQARHKPAIQHADAHRRSTPCDVDQESHAVQSGPFTRELVGNLRTGAGYPHDRGRHRHDDSTRHAHGVDGDEARRKTGDRAERTVERTSAVRGVAVRHHRRRLQVHLPRPEGLWQPDAAQRRRGKTGGHDFRGTGASAATTAATSA